MFRESVTDPFEASMQNGGYTAEFIKRARENQRRREAVAVARRIMKANNAPQWVADLVMDVAELHGVCPVKMLSSGRARNVVAARNEALYAVKATKPMLSSPQMARWFGRDHTTILFAIASHQESTGAPELTRYNINRERRNAHSLAYAKRMREAKNAMDA